jgi:hypothetical protein
MKADLKKPIGTSLHERKTDAHLNKASMQTVNGLTAVGEASRIVLARAANVWAKLVAGFVVKPRYLLAGDQENFFKLIGAQASDIPLDSRLDIAVRSIDEVDRSLADWHSCVITAVKLAEVAIGTLHTAAIGGVYTEAIVQEFIPAQQQAYLLALGCVAVQLKRNDYDQSNCGIVEPGKDAVADKLLSIRDLAA